MNNFIKKEICTALDCVGWCMCICLPSKMHKHGRKQRGLLYPVIDIEKCINCGLCEKNVLKIWLIIRKHQNFIWHGIK